MLKLKFQYFGHLMQRANSFEKTLMLGKIEGRRRKGWQKMRWLGGITDSMDMSLSSGCWWTGKPDRLQSIGSQRVNTTERLNWTECSLIQDHHPSHNYFFGYFPQCIHRKWLLLYSFLIILNIFPISWQMAIHVKKLSISGSVVLLKWVTQGLGDFINFHLLDWEIPLK